MRRPRLITYRLVGARQVFIISLIVIVLITGIVFLQGLSDHRSLLINSFLTITILSVAFFSFVVISLYRGVKLRHDFNDTIRLFNSDYAPAIDSFPDIDIPDLGADDLGGIIISIIVWIFVAIFAVLLLWLLSNVFMAVVMVFVGMLYWVFFRALRLVFRHSTTCKGDFLTCVRIGMTYTLLYNFWIYGIFFLVDYLRHN